jgi:hypothetical protein
MLSAIRKRLTYANVAMTLALVFAMSGGAYAAKHYLITSTKQISPKVLKALKGANGKNGTAGPAGPAGAAGAGTAGAQGAQGAQGPQGPAGTNGEKGTTGTAGTSVTSKEVAAPACTNKEGGSEFTAASGNKTFACNGKEGSPWTASGTLPSGKTLYGEWGIFQKPKEAVETLGNTVSFALPLQSAPAAHILNEHEKELVFNSTTTKVEEVSSTVCKGNAESPTAPSGTLCVYALHEGGLLEPELNEGGFGSPHNVAICAWGDASGCTPDTASRFGFGVEFRSGLTAGTEVVVQGTWAVTG